jgi:DNA primase
MAIIAEHVIHDVLERVDLVHLIKRTVALKEQGTRYLACCPFHTEKTPSFTVDPQKGFYHCFGCGVHGDAIDFLKAQDGLSFMEAIQRLAEEQGVCLGEAEVDPQQEQRRAIYALLEKAQLFFQEQLAANKEVQEYLQKRGVLPDSVKLFGLGYAPYGTDTLYQQWGKTEEKRALLVAAGLIAEGERGYYDRFRGRLIFPIYNSRGRIVGFGGRALRNHQTPKYLNSSESLVFHKGELLFGPPSAKKSKNIIIVEGYMDVIQLVQQGWTEARATLGTALSLKHIDYLWEHYQKLLFCYDGDTAGRAAAERTLHLLLPTIKDGCSVEFAELPEGMDPDSYCRRAGKGAMQAVFERAAPLSAFFFQQLLKEYPLNSPESVALFGQKAKALLRKIPSGIFRSLMFKHLQEQVGLGPKKRISPLAGQGKVQAIESPHAWSVGLSLVQHYPELQDIWAEAVSSLTCERKENNPSEQALAEAYVQALPGSGVKKELLAIIKKLEREQYEKSISVLLEKAQAQGLDKEEKELLKRLLSEKVNR